MDTALDAVQLNVWLNSFQEKESNRAFFEAKQPPVVFTYVVCIV
jgi:hypothetical protein